ncbi:hypothetical protein [Nocardioides hungaricus]
MTEPRVRLGFRDCLWVLFGWALVPATAITMDALGIVNLTRAGELAVVGLSTLAGGASHAYRRQLADRRQG